MGRKAKTHAQFLLDLERVHGDRIVVAPGAEYVNRRAHIPVVCGVCSHEWSTRPDSLINSGHGCPACVTQQNKDSWGKRRCRPVTEDEKAEARELRARGLTYRAIGAQLGRDNKTIRLWCDPASAEKERQRKAAYRATNREACRANSLRYYHETEHGNASMKAAQHARRGVREEWDYEENALVTVYEPELCGSDLTKFNSINEQLRQWNLKDDGVKYSLEHLLPIHHGGSALGWWNLSITPLSENLSKNCKIDPDHMALRRHKINKMFNNA